MERAKKFYAELFDWKIEKFPGPIDYYAITTTAENDEEGLGGGLVKREEPQDTIVNYVDVPSVDEYIDKIETLGGKVVVPKMAISGIGYAAVCIDTENNTFGLLECDEDAKVKRYDGTPNRSRAAGYNY